MPPTTSKVPGDGTATLSYTIPGSGLDVETVRVGVDATAAGGAVTATVTITDQSGVVIATKPQNATIPAGASGSATWALQLDDNAATGTTGSGIQFDVNPQQGDFLDVETIGPNGFGLVIRDRGPGGMYLRSTGNGFLLLEALATMVISGNPLTMFSGGDIEMNLGIGFSATVFNHVGSPVFEVHEDGSIHGLAAVGAITWDL